MLFENKDIFFYGKKTCIKGREFLEAADGFNIKGHSLTLKHNLKIPIIPFENMKKPATSNFTHDLKIVFL